MEKISARRAAVLSLVRIEKDGRYSNIELDSAIKKYALEGAEKGLYSRIVYGVLERLFTLDAILSSVCTRALSSLDAEIKAILRTGAYQLLYLDKIPQSAAVNESVNLAKKFGKGAMGFVNGVLRSVTKIDTAAFFAEKEKALSRAEFLSVKYSVLKETAELILSQYGGDKAEDILGSLLGEDGGVCLRVNTMKTSPEKLAKEMGGAVSELCPSCVVMKKGFAIESEEHFMKKRIYV